MLPERAPAVAVAAAVPTLTEVVELGQQQAGADDSALAVDLASPPAVALPAPPPTTDLAAELLAELLPRVERMLEERLREALAPALARAADGLIRDARDELGSTLQSLVEEAVARLLDERRQR